MKMNIENEELHTLFMKFDKNGRGTVDQINLTLSLKWLDSQAGKKSGGSSSIISSSIIMFNIDTTQQQTF